MPQSDEYYDKIVLADRLATKAMKSMPPAQFAFVKRAVEAQNVDLVIKLCARLLDPGS